MLTAIGLNHHHTPISIRERFALHKAELKEALVKLKNAGVGELAILSTCNRMEVYCKTNDYSPITDWLAQTGKISSLRLDSHLFIAPSRDAVRHIYRVASGLDSMIIGESNIFGQIKDAVRIAQESNTMGTTLHKLFQSSFAVAKEIRSSTEIGRHGVSMASVAIQLAENIFGDLSNSSIMFVGTGEMIKLCATHFCTRRPKNLMFISRDITRALNMSKRFGGEYGVMADIDINLRKFDIVITCTETSIPIIGAGLVQRAIKSRQYQPMMMVDLGVPRNIEPEAKEQNDIYLYSVDELKDIINDNLGHRQLASQQAQIIVESRVDEFMRYLDERKAVGLIKKFQDISEEISQVEIRKAMRKLAIGYPADEVLKVFAHGLTQKHLHPWLTQIHQAEGKLFDDLLNIYQMVLDKSSQKNILNDDENSENLDKTEITDINKLD